MSQKIITSFFENDNSDILFFYCGKNSVLGLAQPDHYTKNSSSHAYARIAFLTMSEINDDETTIYFNETLGVNLITPELGINSPERIFKRVVFPLPLSPIRAILSPSLISMEMELKEKSSLHR